LSFETTSPALPVNEVRQEAMKMNVAVISVVLFLTSLQKYREYVRFSIRIKELIYDDQGPCF
jgi:hypothetical protein